MYFRTYYKFDLTTTPTPTITNRETAQVVTPEEFCNQVSVGDQVEIGLFEIREIIDLMDKYKPDHGFEYLYQMDFLVVTKL